MSTHPFARMLVVCLLLALSAPLAAQLPKSQGYVTDLAGVLDGRAKSEIETRLRSAEEKTSAEIAVATVPSLDGMTVEDYANRLFREWGVGKKGKDNGVLLLVAPTDRKVRIEERRQLVQSDRPPMLLMIPFFGLFVGLGALSVGVGLRAKAFFPLIFGGMFGGIPFLMSLIPFFNAPVVVLGPFAFAIFAFGYVKGGSERWKKITRGTTTGKGQGHDSSGWVMGSSSSSSSGGGSSSSGGSFGGGSSGGGGASGSW